MRFQAQNTEKCVTGQSLGALLRELMATGKSGSVDLRMLQKAML